MAYGFDLGRLKSSSIGVSYVDRIAHNGGTNTRTKQSTAFSYATAVRTFTTPAQNVASNIVPVYPTVTTTLDRSNGIITVTVSGGNVSVNVLIFVS